MRPVSVYLIEQEATGHFKIGVASDPDKRLLSLQAGNPFPLFIQAETPCHDRTKALRLEAMAHEELAHCRTKGEWFSCSRDEALGAILAAQFLIAGAVRWKDAP